jgi:hypothetical protein
VLLATPLSYGHKITWPVWTVEFIFHRDKFLSYRSEFSRLPESKTRSMQSRTKLRHFHDHDQDQVVLFTQLYTIQLNRYNLLLLC